MMNNQTRCMTGPMAAAMVAIAVLMLLASSPSWADHEGDAHDQQQSGFFSRTWHDLKGLFGDVKADSSDAGHKTVQVTKEGVHRAKQAGQAIGDAAVHGAQGVSAAVTGTAEDGSHGADRGHHDGDDHDGD